MDASPIRAEAASLYASYRWLRRAAWAAGAAVLALTPLAFILPAAAWQSALFLALAVSYGASKGRCAFRTQQALWHLSLEERFLQQPLEAPPLRDCLRQQDHLWTHSRAMQGLRQALRCLRPALPSAEEKRRRVQACYRRAFRAARPSIWSLDLGLAVLLVAGGAALGAFSSILGAAALGIVVVLEGAQGALRRALRRGYDALAATLADWTLARHADGALRAEADDPYRHVLLYKAQPWFGDLHAQTAALRQMA